MNIKSFVFSSVSIGLLLSSPVFSMDDEGLCDRKFIATGGHPSYLYLTTPDNHALQATLKGGDNEAMRPSARVRVAQLDFRLEELRKQ